MVQEVAQRRVLAAGPTEDRPVTASLDTRDD
jgi:hypothetical protein